MKIQRPLLIVPILFILALVACNSSMQTNVPTPFQIQTPTVAPTQTIGISPTKSPIDTAAPIDTVTPIVEPLAGVVYRIREKTINQGTLWQIAKDGVAHVIWQGNDIKFSLYQNMAIYQSYDQKYRQCTLLADFIKEKVKSLVCAPDGGYTNQILGWAANDTGTIFGIFNMIGMDKGRGSVGTMSLSDGAIYLIDSEHLTDDAALSPDGQSIAYSSFDSGANLSLAWLYSQESGVVSLSTKNYASSAYPKISNPAWSPDNQKIAWGLKDNNLHGAIGVFDLNNSPYAKIA